MIEIVAEALVIEALGKLGADGGRFASLGVAQRASGLGEEAFRQAVKRLAGKLTITCIPEENQKVITPADLAVWVGGQACHVATIN